MVRLKLASYRKTNTAEVSKGKFREAESRMVMPRAGRLLTQGGSVQWLYNFNRKMEKF